MVGEEGSGLKVGGPYVVGEGDQGQGISCDDPHGPSLWTDRKNDRQTDTTENITFPHYFAGSRNTTAEHTDILRSYPE